MATSGDFLLATNGDFLMAMGSVFPRRALGDQQFSASAVARAEVASGAADSASSIAACTKSMASNA